MIIHVVQPLETIQSIATKYNLPVDKIILDNELPNPNNLVLGQTIVILYPKEIYTVQDGDSIISIANNFGVSPMQLLRNNPSLINREFIYPGETIVISFVDEKIGPIATNGYTYPFIDKDILRKTLPFLTYLTIFAYGVTKEGNLLDINDSEIIQMTKDFGVAPIMLITLTTNQRIFSSDVTHSILSSREKQEFLIDNILNMLKTKGYYGLNIDSGYLLLEDKDPFVNFLNLLTTRLNSEGFIVICTLTPQTFIVSNFKELDYTSIGRVVNRVILLSYEWGFSFGPPLSVTSYDLVRQFLDEAIIQISPDKIFLGIPSIGYNWQLPYIENVSKVYSVSNRAAINLAVEVGATIFFDELLQAPHFHYFDDSTGVSVPHIVWFKDARSINSLVKFVPDYGLYGVGIWNIMSFFAQLWIVINSQYEIISVL